MAERTRRVLVFAQDEARRLGSGSVGSEHLLLGLIREMSGPPARALAEFGVTVELVRSAVTRVHPASTQQSVGRRAVFRRSKPPPSVLDFTSGTKRIFALASRESQRGGHYFIETQHLMLGLLMAGQGAGIDALIECEVDLDRLRQRVIALSPGDESRPRSYEDSAEPPRVGQGVDSPQTDPASMAAQSPRSEVAESDQVKGLQDRLGIIEGLLVALDRWDEVSDVISNSEDGTVALKALMAPPLSFTDEQAKHVIEMPQWRRTARAKRELQEARDRTLQAIRSLPEHEDLSSENRDD